MTCYDFHGMVFVICIFCIIGIDPFFYFFILLHYHPGLGDDRWLMTIFQSLIFLHFNLIFKQHYTALSSQ